LPKLLATGEPESIDVMLQILDEQTFLVQAQMNLEDLNELLKLDLPLKNEYHTLGVFCCTNCKKSRLLVQPCVIKISISPLYRLKGHVFIKSGFIA
jgi:CBS domain containing-hemolysin-like protein